MFKIDSLTIILENQNAAYFTNEYVRGFLQFQANKNIRIKEISLTLYGSASYCWYAFILDKGLY